MNEVESPRRSKQLVFTLLIGGIVVLLGITLLILRNPGVQPKKDDAVNEQHRENYLGQVRNLLARPTSLATSQTVVQLLNSHSESVQEPVPGLSSASLEKLQRLLGLSEKELAEVSSGQFTALDAHHLDACFLFRDAAKSLEVAPISGPEGKVARQSPLDRAVAGFDWVVRQIRPSQTNTANDGGLIPPAAVLRRGIGSALQRSLAYLALLEQFGLDDESQSLQGCLLFCPDEKGTQRLWACGVAVGTQPDALYLFDPRVGLPIPGPGGKGVATLAEVRNNQGVLDQWKFNKLNYDVTAEQAKKAVVRLVVPLTSVAPRIRYLQDHLLRDRVLNGQSMPAAVKVRLAEDAETALSTITAGVVKSGGKAEDVEIWRPATATTRRFLPQSEGGSDESAGKGQPGPRDRFQFGLIPWAAFPAVLGERVEGNSELGLQLRRIFAGAFLAGLVDPASPREMILRGRFNRALPELVREQERLQLMRQTLRQASDIDTNVRQWLEQAAIPAYAELERSRGTAEEAFARENIARLWRWKGGEPIEILLNGRIAEARGIEVMYQLALCRHEQAVRGQLRIDLAKRINAASPADLEKTRKTWFDADLYWKDFLETNPSTPETASAQRLRGEVLAHMGQKAEAEKIWNDLQAAQSDLQKIARLWLARQAAGK